jgi:hypothetical protein
VAQGDYGSKWIPACRDPFDIDRLIEIVEATGVEVSLDRDRLAVLTQYAVPLRYDELLDAESLERETLVVLVDEVSAWVDAKLGP